MLEIILVLYFINEIVMEYLQYYSEMNVHICIVIPPLSVFNLGKTPEVRFKLYELTSGM